MLLYPVCCRMGKYTLFIFVFPVFIFKPLNSIPAVHFTVFSQPIRSDHLHTITPTAILPTSPWWLTSIIITVNTGLNARISQKTVEKLELGRRAKVKISQIKTRQQQLKKHNARVHAYTLKQELHVWTNCQQRGKRQLLKGIWRVTRYHDKITGNYGRRNKPVPVRDMWLRQKLSYLL